MPKTRLHVIISGDVQGVFFRASTRDAARSLGLRGWVRNLPDRRVEAVFEGEKGNLEKVLEFVRKGPPGSSVSGVDVRWEFYKGEFESFDVRY